MPLVNFDDRLFYFFPDNDGAPRFNICALEIGTLASDFNFQNKQFKIYKLSLRLKPLGTSNIFVQKLLSQVHKSLSLEFSFNTVPREHWLVCRGRVPPLHIFFNYCATVQLPYECTARIHNVSAHVGRHAFYCVNYTAALERSCTFITTIVLSFATGWCIVFAPS